MAYSLTARRLIDELKKYDPNSIVMVGNEIDDAIDASDTLTYAYLTPDGELTTEMEMTDNDAVTTMKRVVVIWPAN